MSTPYLMNAWILCIFMKFYNLFRDAILVQGLLSLPMFLPSSSQIFLLSCRSNIKRLLQPAQGAGRVFCAGGDLKMFYNKGKSGTNRSVS